MSPSILQREDDSASPYDPPVLPKALGVKQIAVGVFAGLWAYTVTAAIVYGILRALS